MIFRSSRISGQVQTDTYRRQTDSDAYEPTMHGHMLA